MIRRRITYLMLACLLLLPLRSAYGQGAAATPYQLKAVFLYNFTQFVEWPTETFTNPDAPFTIGLYGPDVFGAYLEEAVRNEKVKGHPIKVISVESPTDVTRCRLLFIHKSKVAEFYAIMPQLKEQSILTVSDAADFCRAGGIIGFISDRNKIRLQINMDAASGAGLKISSKLLRLAEIVSPKS